MKALVLTEYMHFEIQERPMPTIESPDEVLVRVKAVSICGSDVHGMDGSTGRRRPPIVMGHEAAGTIEAVGPAVEGYRVGDRVTFDSTIWCGSCFHCLRGEPNLCDNRMVLGVSCDEYRRDGAFAEYIVVPERILWRLPEGLDFVDAAMAEPLGVAAHAQRIAAPPLGASVAVVGSGLIGLLLIQVLRASGAGKIIALDVDRGRLERAREFGADLIFDAADPVSVEEVRAATAGRGVDFAFEAVGASAPINTAIQCVRKGGSVVLVGNVSPSIELPLQSVVTRQVSLLGSCAIAGEYGTVLELMAAGRVNVRPLISAVAPLTDAPSWFSRLYAREPGLLKVVLEP